MYIYILKHRNFLLNLCPHFWGCNLFTVATSRVFSPHFPALKPLPAKADLPLSPHNSSRLGWKQPRPASSWTGKQKNPKGENESSKLFTSFLAKKILRENLGSKMDQTTPETQPVELEHLAPQLENSNSQAAETTPARTTKRMTHTLLEGGRFLSEILKTTKKRHKNFRYLLMFFKAISWDRMDGLLKKRCHVKGKDPMKCSIDHSFHYKIQNKNSWC